MAYARQPLGCVPSAAVALRMCTAAVELHAERHHRSPYVHCSCGLQAERRCRSWLMHSSYWAACRASPSLSICAPQLWAASSAPLSLMAYALQLSGCVPSAAVALRMQLLSCMLSVTIALHMCTAAVGCKLSADVAHGLCAAAIGLHAERRRRSLYVHGSRCAAC